MYIQYSVRLVVCHMGWDNFDLGGPPYCPATQPILPLFHLPVTYTFNLTLGHKSPKIVAKSFHRGPRNLVSDATFKAKKRQPKLEMRTLIVCVRKQSDRQAARVPVLPRVRLWR